MSDHLAKIYYGSRLHNSNCSKLFLIFFKFQINSSDNFNLFFKNYINSRNITLYSLDHVGFLRRSNFKIIKTYLKFSIGSNNQNPEFEIKVLKLFLKKISKRPTTNGWQDRND